MIFIIVISLFGIFILITSSQNEIVHDYSYSSSLDDDLDDNQHSSDSLDSDSSSDSSHTQDSSSANVGSGSSSSGSGGTYVGSVNSNKFHYPSCRYAGKIKPGNLITFSSREDAISRGYSPCKVCSP